MSFGTIWQHAVPLSSMTTWRIGGPADHVVRPTTEAQLRETLQIAAVRRLPVHVLGRGSNVLCSDRGLRGLTVDLRRFEIGVRQVDRHHVVSGAGTPLPQLASTAARSGWSGFTFCAGIPGTVGGAVVMNAGTSTHTRQDIAQVLTAVDVLTEDDRVVRRQASELGLAYRASRLAGCADIVLRAWFRIWEFRSPALLRDQMSQHLDSRRWRQPLREATAGSVFKRPVDGDPAGYYLDAVGLRGKRLGGAQISTLHANWIVNKDHATASDIRDLIELGRRRVHQQFDVVLDPEVHVWDADGNHVDILRLSAEARQVRPSESVTASHSWRSEP